MPDADPAAAAADRILDAALALGEQRGWDAVHLHVLARATGLTLAEIRRCYAHQDAIAEAWFDRADAVLLAAPETPGWGDLTPRRRLQSALSSWLGALAAHRRLTAQMLRYKLQPEHLHLQAQGVLRVSRTVQWWREVAWLPSTGWRREAEEAALTAIFLSTFACWLGDRSPGDERTQRWLARQFDAAEAVARRLGPGG